MTPRPGRHPGEAAALRQAALLPCRLLIVGDGQLDDGLAVLLQANGFGWSAVATASEALEAQRRDPCSVVLASESLPDGSGIALLAALRATARSGHLYTILRAAGPQTRRGTCDCLLAPQAGKAELLRALRTARRAVTLHRTSRVSGGGNRDSALAEQVSGRYAGLHFLSELLRCAERLRHDPCSLMLLVVHVEGDLRDEQLHAVVTGLFSVVSSDDDVVARLSASTFGLLLNEPPVDTDQRLRTTLLERLHAVAAADASGIPDFRFGCAAIRGPLESPDEQVLAIWHAAATMSSNLPGTTAAAGLLHDAGPGALGDVVANGNH